MRQLGDCMRNRDRKSRRHRADARVSLRRVLVWNLSSIQSKNRDPLRPRIVDLNVDLDGHRNASILGRGPAAMPFVNVPEHPRDHQEPAIRLRAAFVRLHGMIA